MEAFIGAVELDSNEDIANNLFIHMLELNVNLADRIKYDTNY